MTFGVGKIFAILAVLAMTAAIGIMYVGPRVLLKLTRQISRSTPADYGMRFDEVISVSDDSLDIYGDHIYPFHAQYNGELKSHTLIVLHAVSENSKSVYPQIKSLITVDVNFLTIDSRGHGRSGGHFYTLGVKEAKDITNFIDDFTAQYPDHSFGIFAKGNSGNIALKAMENDKRIHYGIVENYFETVEEHIKYLNYGDVLYNGEAMNNYLAETTLSYLNSTRKEIRIDPSKIEQAVLLLSTPYNYDIMDKLHSALASDKNILSLYKENITLSMIAQDDEGLYECVREFVDLHSGLAIEKIKREYFRLADEH